VARQAGWPAFAIDPKGRGGPSGAGPAPGRRNRTGTDATASAGAVIDHHDLPERGLQTLRDDARQHIVRSAGTRRHDDADRFCRP